MKNILTVTGIVLVSELTMRMQALIESGRCVAVTDGFKRSRIMIKKLTVTGAVLVSELTMRMQALIESG